MPEKFNSEPAWLKLLLLGFWLLLMVVIFGSKVRAPDLYHYFVAEDSFSEYAQALLYLLASVVSALIVRCAIRHKCVLLACMYTILATGLLFVCMEEISWGQRIFDIPNPEYFARYNEQQELTLHNLNTVRPVLRYLYIGIGLYGALSWIFIAPLLLMIKPDGSSLLHYISPPWYLMPYFLVCAVIYAFLHIIRPKYYMSEFGLKIDMAYWKFLHWREEEHAELFLALGFFFFTLLSYRKLKRYLAG